VTYLWCKIIDTPGIKVLGSRYEPAEISGYFPNFKMKKNFANSITGEEPKCAVKEALEKMK
jgi:putative ribosome biogenesis GTPase RsgA